MRVLLVTNKVKTYPLMYRLILETLHELGHQIVWAADFSQFIGDIEEIPCETRSISIFSNPFKIRNYKALRQILKIIDDENIEGVMCNTPIGSTLARLAALKKHIAPVVYTAHGFLFFRGAPFINNTIFKWQEEWFAHFTDILITITEEDYEAAKRFKLRGGSKPYLIHGAGIKLGVKVCVERKEKKKEIGIPDNSFLIISAGDLNRNKNTEVMVKALAELKGENIHYIACGEGPEEEKLRKLAHEMGVENIFHLLGYRTDVAELMSISDAFVMMSFREGLPRSIMEAMDMGLPCVGSDTRGIRDLIEEGKGGFICNPRKPKEFANAVIQLKNNPQLCHNMGLFNKEKVKPYSFDVVKKELKEIYNEAFSENLNLKNINGKN